jgi:hypothetical protein
MSQKRYCWIEGKKWYFYLKPNINYPKTPSLLSEMPLERLTKALTVCHTRITLPDGTRRANGKDFKLYSYFENYVDFYCYMANFISVSERSFFEIIFGTYAQKPHFDIDIDIETVKAKYPEEDIEDLAKYIVDTVLTSCIEVLKEVKINLDIETSVLVYTSHNEKKKSFHLLLNRLYHRNNTQAKNFYFHVMDKFRVTSGGKYIEFVDKAVYSAKQQFRILGCQKPGTGRIKTFQPIFTFLDTTYSHIYYEDLEDETLLDLCKLYESLVTFVSGCRMLPDFKEKERVVQQSIFNYLTKPNNESSVMLHINKDIGEAAFQKLKQVMQPCPFSYHNKINENIIELTRNAPSMCPNCNTVHHNQHPFLSITQYGHIYWNCRRGNKEDKKFYVGQLSEAEIDTAEKIVIKNQKELKHKHIVYDPLPIEETVFSFGSFQTKAFETLRVTNPHLFLPESEKKKEPIILQKKVLKTKKVSVPYVPAQRSIMVNELYTIALQNTQSKEATEFLNREKQITKPKTLSPAQEKKIPIIKRKVPLKIISQ